MRPRDSLWISHSISDMTSLAEITDHDFDVVAALDNALPHLTADQLRRAVGAMGSKLKPNGLFTASIRDYDTLILEDPLYSSLQSMVGREIGGSFIRFGLD